MPNREAAPDIEFERAALVVDAELRTELGGPQEQLSAADLTAAYPTRRFVRGWRIGADCSDGIHRRIDLLLSRTFPSGFPRTALVDRPEHMTWPHIEHDGVLCLLPLMADVDAEKPGAVAINLVGRSFRLIEELVDGKIVDRDFREEFLTYWFYGSDSDAPRVYSLVRPGPPSRVVRSWRDGKGLVVVGDDQASLEKWLTDYRDAAPGRSWRTEQAALIWLGEPLLPSEYPVTAADLLPIAERSGEDALATLGTVASALPEDTLVLMGAEGRGGPGLMAVTTTSARRVLSRTGRVERPLTKGFRDAEVPPEWAIARTYSPTPLLRSNVARADAAWIHGRGQDPRSAPLLERTVTVIGCGSVGSSVAARLARAGIGRLRLYDHDELSWSNVGRHELGARSVGQDKAVELARRLAADFPHLSITGEPFGAHALITLEAERLRESDLVLAATGSWQADGELNRWHVDEGRQIPFVYGWAENHASAGHAVVIGPEGGCLRCGVGPTGVPMFQATAWPEGEATLEEPACGNHFQPYGAVELGFVVDLLADAAVQALLEPTNQSSESLWLTRTNRLYANGGNWSEQIHAMFGEHFEGGRWTTRVWPTRECIACGAEA
jgi:hypothetical protein